MQTVLEFSRAFGFGAASAATLWLWRGGAAEWSRKFSLSKQFMKLLLLAVAGVTTLGGLWVLDQASDAKLFLLGALAGVVVPRVTQFCWACVENALKDRKRGAAMETVPPEVRRTRTAKKYAYPQPGRVDYGDVPDGRPTQVRVEKERPANHKPAVSTAAVPLARATSPNRPPTAQGRRDTMTKVLVTRATPLPKKPT